jgi:hypothetical protein
VIQSNGAGAITHLIKWHARLLSAHQAVEKPAKMLYHKTQWFRQVSMDYNNGNADELSELPNKR